MKHRVFTCQHCGQNFASKGGYTVHLKEPKCPVLRERARALDPKVDTEAPVQREAHHNRWRQRMQFAGGGIAWEPRRGQDE